MNVNEFKKIVDAVGECRMWMECSPGRIDIMTQLSDDIESSVKVAECYEFFKNYADFICASSEVVPKLLRVLKIVEAKRSPEGHDKWCNWSGDCDLCEGLDSELDAVLVDLKGNQNG